jgi:hypothetical protein
MKNVNNCSKGQSVSTLVLRGQQDLTCRNIEIRLIVIEHYNYHLVKWNQCDLEHAIYKQAKLFRSEMAEDCCIESTFIFR